MPNKEFPFPHSPLKIAFGIFISLVFVTIAYFLIMSAKGYKFEFNDSSLTLTKTGTIVVATQPSGANIFINDKLQKKKTGSTFFNSKLGGILPGTYTLRIEKEGYQTWNREITVVEELVAFVNHIILFPEDPVVENIHKASITLAEQSGDNRKTVYVSESDDGESEIWVLENESLNKTKIHTFTIKQTIEGFQWSKDNNKILVKYLEGEVINYLIIGSRDGSEITNITETFEMQFESLLWNPADSDEVFGLEKGSVYKINIKNEVLTGPLVSNVISFVPEHDRHLYFVKNTKAKIGLWRTNLEGENIELVVNSLPESTIYKIKRNRDNGQIFILANDTIRTAYLVIGSGEDAKLEKIKDNVTDAFWSPNGQKIMFINEDNVWSYDINKQKFYITAKDRDIRSATWIDSEHHIALNLGGTYTFAEFENNLVTTFGQSTLGDVFFSPSNKNFIYINEEGLNVLKR